MIFYAAEGLVLAGVLLLLGALAPVRELMARLPPGPVRTRWFAMTTLIVVFVAGYIAYAAVLWGYSHSSMLELIVPLVFFFGACFVWLSVSLALRTTIDVMRMRLLERETVTDALTGVMNRRYLDRRLAEEAASARRYGLALSFMLLDIDHFKRVNDSYGHRAGDDVLAGIGDIVAKDLRESDVLARYGGEEFAIVAPQTSLDGAVDVAERVRRHIEAHDFEVRDAGGGRRGIRLTVSIGAASFGDGITTVDDLLRAADANLYRAKQQGRNRVSAGTAATRSGAVAEG